MTIRWDYAPRPLRVGVRSENGGPCRSWQAGPGSRARVLTVHSMSQVMQACNLQNQVYTRPPLNKIGSAKLSQRCHRLGRVARSETTKLQGLVPASQVQAG